MEQESTNVTAPSGQADPAEQTIGATVVLHMGKRDLVFTDQETPAPTWQDLHNGNFRHEVEFGRALTAEMVYDLQERAAAALGAWFDKVEAPREVRELADSMVMLYWLGYEVADTESTGGELEQNKAMTLYDAFTNALVTLKEAKQRGII